MALWDFRRESTATVSGANTVAGIKAGYQAPYVAGTSAHQTELAEKRNVIATSLGWVRRVNQTNMHGTARQIDQVIVAANPGSGADYTSTSNLGQADIAQIYVKLNANGYIGANTTNANLYVVFNTPIARRVSANAMAITVANTAGGNNAVARLTTAFGNTYIINANNTLVFRLPLMQGRAGSLPGTYKIDAQTISVTGMPLYNPDIGTTASANLVITGAVSNNLLDDIGTRITTFRVARPAGQV